MPLFLLVSVAAIAAMSLLGVAVPLLLAGHSDSSWREKAIEVATYITGGVFLGAGMLHMLPEAEEEARSLDMPLPSLVNPYTAFALGYLVVYTVEVLVQEEHAHSLPKTSILAVAQRARANASTASICLVEVPPVTTYHHKATGWAEPAMSSSLIRHPSGAACPGTEDCFSHAHTHDEGGGGGSHSPHSHSHSPHSHSHSPPSYATEVSGVAHTHDHGHSARRVSPVLPAPLLPSSVAEPRGFMPPIPTRAASAPAAKPSNGWYDSCDECETHGENPLKSHDHVHVGVRHKHVNVGGGRGGAATMPLVLALLFSVHSFTAGLALGVQSSMSGSAVAILVAILGHKFVEALSLASSFVKEGVHLRTSLSLLLVYCTMTPFGVLVGWWISDLGPEATAVEALVSGFAAGSFVFLAAHELQPAEGHRPAASLSRGTRAGLAFGGLGCMALLVFMGA
jgi:zinc transporter ZupT